MCEQEVWYCYKHATTALNEGQGEDVIQAWLQAATTAEDMYT
jgi:hypothetical protein